MAGWKQWPLLAAVAVTASTCGDSTAPPDTGTFQATVTGEISAELAGPAEFGIYAGEGFGMSMSGELGHLLGIGQHAEIRPDVGAHPIGDPDEGGLFALYLVQTAEGVAAFVSRSGELEVTTSTPERFEGAFAISAFGEIPGESGEREVWLSGTFSASCAGAARCD